VKCSQNLRPFVLAEEYQQQHGYSHYLNSMVPLCLSQVTRCMAKLTLRGLDSRKLSRCRACNLQQWIFNQREQPEGKTRKNEPTLKFQVRVEAGHFVRIFPGSIVLCLKWNYFPQLSYLELSSATSFSPPQVVSMKLCGCFLCPLGYSKCRCL
jgi:hypothetical protein